jgi:hypothetical protein
MRKDQLSGIRRDNMMVTLLQVFGVYCWIYVFWDTLFMAVVGKEENKAERVVRWVCGWRCKI